MEIKKEIPIAIEKTKFVKLYYPMPERFVREEINRIILNNRKLMKESKKMTDFEITRTHFVYKEEFIQFAKIYGVPENYTLS